MYVLAAGDNPRLPAINHVSLSNARGEDKKDALMADVGTFDMADSARMTSTHIATG